MSDEVSRILKENQDGESSSAKATLEINEETFDEWGYLRDHPDVADGVKRGLIRSGYEHYLSHGKAEGRLAKSRAARDTTIWAEDPKVKLPDTADVIPHTVEALLISRGGGVMVVGWIDDAADILEYVQIIGHGLRIRISKDNLIRVRRVDVEVALGGNTHHPYGFLGFHFLDAPVAIGKALRVELITRRMVAIEITAQPRYFEESELRDVVLSYLSEAHFFGNAQTEAMSYMDFDFGNQVIALNRAITRGIVRAPYIERFGVSQRPILGSIVVCLYGRAEYMFLQAALYSGLPGIEDYEFVYVSNSPELAETLLREVKITSKIYGLRQTLVLLPGNAGFGAANNAAVSAARSDRILIVNPDVFPYDKSWAQKHIEVIKARPASETRIFGVPLYYDDGSLMHGGMYFEIDAGILLRPEGTKRVRMVRVEHYGKGAPVWAEQFTRRRPVPAVTGAFISCDRAWYERLGGFTEDYVFGHYEDADLCLKSIASGTAPWMHDLRLWHLEGKGSTRRPVHEGGSLVNRWLFSSRWANSIEEGLLGRTPRHPLLHHPAEPVAMARQGAPANATLGSSAATLTALVGAPLSPGNEPKSVLAFAPPAPDAAKGPSGSKYASQLTARSVQGSRGKKMREAGE